MSNPIRYLSLKEKLIWISLLSIIAVTNILIEDFDFLWLIASCIAVTSLILAAKGNVWSQILMIIYLGTTMPMAIFSTITT